MKHKKEFGKNTLIIILLITHPIPVLLLGIIIGREYPDLLGGIVLTIIIYFTSLGILYTWVPNKRERRTGQYKKHTCPKCGFNYKIWVWTR